MTRYCVTHCIVGKTAGDRSWRSGKPILSAGFHDIRVLFRTKAFVKEGHKIHIKWILFGRGLRRPKKKTLCSSCRSTTLLEVKAMIMVDTFGVRTNNVVVHYSFCTPLLLLCTPGLSNQFYIWRWYSLKKKNCPLLCTKTWF